MEASLDSLPTRLFLDSSTLQSLRDYDYFLWENEPVPLGDRIYKIPNGIENLEALQRIFFVNERATFQFILSENSIVEAEKKRDAGHLRWALDVLDHSMICLEETGAASEESTQLAGKLDKKCFGYLGAGDRALIKDAVRLQCDAFLTMERRLPTMAEHIQRELGLRVLNPIQYWELLQPWAGLFV